MLVFQFQKKQFRRVQRLEDDESEEEEGDGRERVANELFEGSDQVLSLALLLLLFYTFYFAILFNAPYILYYYSI